jgi:hypothetical protein
MQFRWEVVTGLPGTGLPGTGLPGTGLPGTGLPVTGLPGTTESIVHVAIVKIELRSSYPRISTEITSWVTSFPNKANTEQERSWASIRKSP